MDKHVSFSFGKNWQSYLETLDDVKIKAAEESLTAMLEIDNLYNSSFLDIGSGSGLFSLVARRLGAAVHSFDLDPISVKCTKELYDRYFPGDTSWKIEQGSVLDPAYLATLGRFDIVYSWGVLHHTGDMWKSLALVAQLVKPKGKLFIAIYNDQGVKSKIWKIVKKTYNLSPKIFRPLIIYLIAVLIWGEIFVRDFIKYGSSISWNNYLKNRGMSPWQDLIDWVGGYPFEVARPDEIINFYEDLGFRLCKFKSAMGSLGNNEYLFMLKE